MKAAYRNCSAVSPAIRIWICAWTAVWIRRGNRGNGRIRRFHHTDRPLHWLCFAGSRLAGGKGHDARVQGHRRKTIPDCGGNLTYAAVSIAAVPIAISYHMKAKSQTESVQPQQQPTADGENIQTGQAQPTPILSFGAAILQLLVLGLASPFLELQDPLHGIIGLVILMVGIRIAWQITAGSRRASIEGPYENSSAASV